MFAFSCAWCWQARAVWIDGEVANRIRLWNERVGKAEKQVEVLERDNRMYWKAVVLLKAFDAFATPGPYNGSPFEAEVEAFLTPRLNELHKRKAEVKG